MILDILNGFHTVQDESLIFKLPKNGISVKLLLNLQKIFNILITENGFIFLKRWNCRCSQCLNLGHLLFLIYINELIEGLTSNLNVVVDDTTPFSLANNSYLSRNGLIEDLAKISNETYQWNMSFNPDSSKQLQK